MSAEGYLEDEATRHAIYVQLYAAHQSEEIAVFIQQLIDTAKSRLKEGMTTYGTRRYEQQIRVLQKDLAAIQAEMKGQMLLNLGEFAEAEVAYSVKLMEQAVKPVVQFDTPSPQIVRAAALSEPMQLEARTGVQKINIRGALDEFGAKKTAEIISDINKGAALGETTPQITRRLASTHQLQRDQADALVRTVTNHVASVARSATMNENEDILAGKRRIATLDGRTTPLCRSLDNKVVPLEAPSPPFHWRCRTSEIPELRPEYKREIPGSVRPAVGPNGVEQVSSKTTYGEWLARQLRRSKRKSSARPATSCSARAS